MNVSILKLKSASPVRLHYLLALLSVLSLSAVADPVTLPAATRTDGYVCRLLINEIPFPGERGYVSEEDSIAAMEQLLLVLHGRLTKIPPPYLQQHVADIETNDIIDLITAGGDPGQFDGFYLDEDGEPAMVARITERVDNLVEISKQGQPGRFTRLLTHAIELATRYATGTHTAADRFADILDVEGVAATGGAYAWMTDEMRFHPGGNYLRITDSQQGVLGGNRFFTLRKEPQ